MKRKLILALTVFYVISFTGCSTAQVEKESVTIESRISSPASVTPAAVPSASSSGSSPDTPVSLESDRIDGNTASTPSVSPTLLPSISPTVADTASELNGFISDNIYTAVIELEGTEETVNYKTYHSNLGFQMAFDIDRFSVISTKFEDGNWKDSFVAENTDPDIYPYVYISILRGVYPPASIHYDEKLSDSWFLNNTKYYYTDVKDDKGVIISGIGLKESDELVTQDTVQLGNSKAYHFVVKEGNDWDSILYEDYFIVENDYVYLIHVNYFLEASEGYGARIREMLNTISFE